MSSQLFKVSTIAATVFSALSANAAIYQVEDFAPEGASVSTYGVAVQASSGSEDCWNGTCGNYEIAAETKKKEEGYNYRDEAPFFMPFGFDYLDDNWDGFRNYCRSFLGYSDSLCDSWADKQWDGYSYEKNGNYTNSLAFVSPSQSEIYPENTVVNALNSAGNAIGNRRDNTNRNVGFVEGTYSATELLPSGAKASHVWAELDVSGKSFIAGSVSRKHETSETEVTSKATVWVDGVAKEIPWQQGAEARDSVRPQGSARDLMSDGTNVYAVGYNTDSDERFFASVFKSTDSGATWTNKFVTGYPYETDKYLNTVFSSVNDNSVAIGTAKLREAQNGAYANGLFYVTSLTSPVYRSFSGPIFFTGANGKAGAINNFNEVVGQIDFEDHREVNGKPRAHRGFIAPLNASNTDDSRMSRLQSRAWYLDDLTNDGVASSTNNQYRIIDATDINDAGVISGTAYKCAGGYETTNIDSRCAGTESVVAVKLTPITGAASSDIQPRGITQETVERKGGTIGLLLLSVLGFIGFRRK